jgi:hypothetical protein
MGDAVEWPDSLAWVDAMINPTIQRPETYESAVPIYVNARLLPRAIYVDGRKQNLNVSLSKSTFPSMLNLYLYLG